MVARFDRLGVQYYTDSTSTDEHNGWVLTGQQVYPSPSCNRAPGGRTTKARVDFRRGFPVGKKRMEHHVLLIEGDPAIASVVQEALAGAREGSFVVEWVKQLADGLESLKKEIITDRFFGTKNH